MPAPTTPVSWLLAPACSATAVRDALVDTANPWKRPAVMLAAPIATISWFGSTSSPRRAAKLDAVAMVSVRLTRVMPTAPSSSGPDVAERGPRAATGGGCPGGARPTVVTPLAGEAEHRRDDGGADHGDQHRRQPSGEPGEHEQHDEHADADGEGLPHRLVEVLDEARERRRRSRRRRSSSRRASGAGRR